ncbi:MAG TPA: MBL fold metallo-hydrolase [Cyclobacteriaceae bacterium]|nr:MBL fold metallo-hydrolase [Cyclobacteriaceae bacterium]
MDVNIQFLGAAKSVTGSKYLLDISGKKIMVDCGLFQGLKQLRLRNWNDFPIPPKEVEVIIITHAHIDHIGYLPRMVNGGFHGRIICTQATEDLMKIMLLDAAKLQEEEARFALKRGYSKHAKPEPLFTIDDAERVLTLVESYPMEKQIDIENSVTITFHNVGHILGAAFVEMDLRGTTQKKKIVFSGDVGRYDDPILYNPKAIPQADVVLVESTYGDRLNPMNKVAVDLAKIIHEAVDHDGVIVIPAFAVGRTQTLIYYFHQLMEAKAIPILPVYIDSPMAIRATDIYERNSAYHKIEVKKVHEEFMSIFDSSNIHFCNTAESSKALNDIKSPCIIISASGMLTGGRILHHLYHRLRNEQDTFLFAGFQAEGTRGRTILQGGKFVKLFGEQVPVNCHVREIHGLSAHADQSELLRWLDGLNVAPKKIFITHGEETVAMNFAATIRQKRGWDPIVPSYLQSFELFKGI